MMESFCEPKCGDGSKVGWEVSACEDGNTVDGDGCSSECSVESGYLCKGGSESSIDICAVICGDGRRMGSEVRTAHLRAPFDAFAQSSCMTVM